MRFIALVVLSLCHVEFVKPIIELQGTSPDGSDVVLKNDLEGCD
jgi:hypothetical protein